MGTGATTDRLWRALMKRRITHRWGNFSWLSLNTLLLSANDAIAKLDATIVDNRRIRWVAAQRARGVDPSTPIALPDARTLVALGDPGEMDASQYVVVRDLIAADPDVLLLMSDIVYPAGDVNAWRDAVYLPYLGLPEAAWAAAARAAGAGDLAIPDWHLLATPGNHDWYDGLTGFMYHACGAEPLPPVTYSRAGLTLSQRLTRRIWQNPARPDRRMLTPLREQASARWSGRPPGPMPFQPGPYFAVDVGRAGVAPAMRIVSVDTGVGGSIDVEQARWLREMLRGPVPKVVVTGKPIATGDRLRDIPINRAVPPPADPQDPPDDLPDGVRELLAGGDRVVAAVAGDIHNSQRLVLAGRLEGDKLTLDATAARRLRLPPVQIVSGGGGAYLSETHATPLDPDGELVLRGRAPLPDPLPPAAHARFPSREQSVRMFANRAGRVAGSLLAVAGLLALAAAAAVAWLAEAGVQVCVPRACVDDKIVVAAPFVLAALAVVGVLAFKAFTARRWRTFAALLVVTVLLALVFERVWGREFLFAPALLGALGFALVAPLLPFLVPLMQFFPGLARLIPLRTLFVAAAGVVLQQQVSGHLDNLALVITLLAAAVAAIALLARLVDRLLRFSDRLATERRWPWFRGALGVLSLWPAGFIVGAILLLPEGSGGWEHARHAAGMIVLIELLVVLAVLLWIAGRSVWTARHTAPRTVLAAAAGAALLAGAAAAYWTHERLGDTWLVVLLGAASAACAAALVLGAVLWASVGAVSSDESGRDPVTTALAARDHGGGDAGLRDRHLFRMMAIAAVPGISEIAESQEEPFHKCFLKITPTVAGGETTAIVFEAYGVDHEHGSRAADGGPPRAARVVDRLEVLLPERPGSRAADRGLRPG